MTLRQMQDNIQFAWSRKKAFLYLRFLVFFLLPFPLYLLPCLQTGNFYIALGAFTVCSMVTIAYYIKKFSFILFFIVTSLSSGLFFITIGITYEFFLEGALYTGIIYLLDLFFKKYETGVYLLLGFAIFGQASYPEYGFLFICIYVIVIITAMHYMCFCLKHIDSEYDLKAYLRSFDKKK